MLRGKVIFVASIWYSAAGSIVLFRRLGRLFREKAKLTVMLVRKRRRRCVGRDLPV